MTKNGIACPRCGAETVDAATGILTAETVCPNCGGKDERIIKPPNRMRTDEEMLKHYHEHVMWRGPS